MPGITVVLLDPFTIHFLTLTLHKHHIQTGLGVRCVDNNVSQKIDKSETFKVESLRSLLLVGAPQKTTHDCKIHV